MLLKLNLQLFAHKKVLVAQETAGTAILRDWE